MKRILILLTIVLSTTSAFAQHEAGSLSIIPKAGLSLANFMDAGESKMRPNIMEGVEFDCFLTSKFSLSLGVVYSKEGTNSHLLRYNNEELKSNIEIDFIKLPFLLNCYYNEHFAFKTGIQFGIKLHDSYNLKYPANDTNVNTSGRLSDLDIKTNGVELSLPIGISYEIANYIIEVRYSIGLTKLFKDMDARTSAFQFTLGYRIPIK